MASISHDKKTGRRTIQFVARDGKRKSVRLGKLNKKQAETAKLFIEDLVACSVSGGSPKGTTAEWLADLPDTIRRRIERTGLISPRERIVCPTLAEWLQWYVESRRDVKEATRLHYKQVRGDLLGCFPGSKRLDAITAGDADDFRIYLHDKGLAEGTIRRRCGRAKQFFKAALKRKLISENPFADIKCGNISNPERFYFVSDAEIEAVIDACPDVEWKAIFALARYGGLRCPSEVLGLRWQDIHWDRLRFTVRSPKTEYQGKSSRVVPLFAPLHAILLEAFEQAAPGAVYVVERYRDTRSNLRTQAHRIIRKAGLEPWGKTFQNCRSSRETELVETFPIQTVTAWLGNSPQIAAKHYLQVREEHFTKAVQNPVQSASVSGRTQSHAETSDSGEPYVCGDMQKETTLCGNTESYDAPRVGLEPTT